MLRYREFPETRASLLAALGEEQPAQAAWREFYDRYAPAVYRVSRLRGLDANDAEDVVQQVMVTISRHIGTFEYDTSRGQFRHWVRRVTESRISDLCRRRPREVADANILDGRADDSPPIEELWAREWEVQDMLFCLDQVAGDIAPRRLEAFRNYVLDGLSAEDTAKRLGLTTGHVYVIRNVVINLMRKRMEELEEGGSRLEA